MKKKQAFLFLFLLSFSLAAESFVVLIDPGHGGHEHGATSEYKSNKKKIKVYEKDLSLRLAKKLKSLLDRKFTTYLTRSFDRLVSLEERAEMADTVKADLFISIHFNSASSSKSHGFETYYLENKKDAAVRKVERIENSSVAGSEKIVNQILIDLVIQKTAHSSKKLASSIHTSLKHGVAKTFHLRDRGIKGGLFYVLALSKRPGVLIEGGFMSNINELMKIKSNNFLNEYAYGIYQGVMKYHRTLPKKKVPLF